MTDLFPASQTHCPSCQEDEFFWAGRCYCLCHQGRNRIERKEEKRG